ncbi:MAG TPA: DUF2339 domain-containing protein [Gemmatimonadales bacterium]
MADERLQELERRVAELEGIVRQLLVRSIAAPLARSARDLPARTMAPAPSPAPAAPVAPRVMVKPKVEIPPSGGASDRGIDFEQWVGQRGLLIVGVLALLATGGFFLNYAILHGWIPPVVRASGAILAGAGLAVWGDRLVRRGLQRYGAAIIGGGGGLLYLGIWAAAGPYELVGRQIGIMLLAATSGLIVALAIRHAVEGLAIWALAGAYLAPIFLHGPTPEPEKFLAYLAVIGAIWMILAQRVHWRTTFNSALFGFFLIPATVMPNAMNTPAGVNYVVFGMVLALLATHPRSVPWPEGRLGALVIGWTLLFASHADDRLRWIALGGGALVTVIVWWQQRDAAPLAGLRENRVAAEFLVYLTPLVLIGLAAFDAPNAIVAWGGALPLAFGVLYLGSGWVARAEHMIVMGFVLIGLAISGQWNGATVAAGWAVLAAAASASGRWAKRPGAAEVGAAIAAFAFVQLFTWAMLSANSPVLLGTWSRAWYVALAGLALTAHCWDTRREAAHDNKTGLVLWSLAAGALLAGGSVELIQIVGGKEFLGGAVLVLYWSLFALGLTRAAGSWPPFRDAFARRVAAGLFAGAYVVLFTMMPDGRPAADPAFLGTWSLAWYVSGVTAVLAAWWSPAGSVRALLWWMAGICVFIGGSLELRRAFPSELAGDLAISTFWLLYAGALVSLGFRLDQKVVRSAGLGVAALAALKIVVYDLAALQALYRVGSFFVLALITLAVAYAYNQRARRQPRASAE